MPNVTVSISDAQVIADPGDVLVTYSLGSCIGVAVYDPVSKVAGMLHYQLPSASMDAKRAAEQPCMFADTGMENLLHQVLSAGGMKKRLKVKLAGGAQMFDDGGVFSIGKRNHAAIRKVLWQQGLLIEKEDVGGSSPRTMYLAAADGACTIKSGGTAKPL
jgi:chemotaxis protein CheD